MERVLLAQPLGPTLEDWQQASLPSSNTFHMMLTDLQWQFQVLGQVLMEASWISLEQFKLLHLPSQEEIQKLLKVLGSMASFYTVAD